MSTVTRIRIVSEADNSGFDKADAGMSKLESRAKGLSETLATGLGIGIGDRVISGLAQIPQFFQQAVSDGIKFNSTIEGARLGIAAVMKQFDQDGKFGSFNDALRGSGEAIDLLKEKALQSPATFEQLVSGFQGLSGAFASAGLQMKQQVDLVVLMSQALSGLGIRSDQLLQESRALVTGNITEDAMAARILGITKAQVDNARESGQLFDFLTGKLSAFAEAGAAGAQSYATQMSNLEDNLTQLKGVATEEFFAQIRDGLKDVNAELGSDKAAQWAAGMGAALAQVGAAAGDMKARADEALTRINETMGGAGATINSSPLFKAFANMAGLGAPSILDGVKTGFGMVAGPAMEAKQVDQLGKERLRLNAGLHDAHGEKEEAAAIKAIEDAIAARRKESVAASGMEKIHLEDQVKILERMLAQRARLLGTTAEKARGDTIPGLNVKETEAEAKARDEERKRAGRERAMEQAIADSESGGLSGGAKLADLQRRRREMADALADDLFKKEGKIVPTGNDFSAGGANAAIKGIVDPDAAAEYASRLKDILAVEKEIDSERAKQGDELDKNMAKQGEIFRTRRAALEDMQGEHDVLLAQLSGNQELAGKLQLQHELKTQLAALDKAGILDATTRAAAEANVAAQLELQKQKQRQVAAEAQAANNVAEAANGRSKSKQIDAQVTEARLQKENELKGAGLAPDQARKLSDDAGEQLRRKLRRESGIIGGSAGRSSRDDLGGGSDNLHAGPSADFRKAFGGGIGDAVPIRPGNAPVIGAAGAPAAAPDAAGGGQQNAGNMQGQAASLQQKAAQTQQQAAAAQMQAAQASLAAAQSSVRTNQAVLGQLQTVVTRLDDLEGQIQNLRNY